MHQMVNNFFNLIISMFNEFCRKFSKYLPNVTKINDSYKLPLVSEREALWQSSTFQGIQSTPISNPLALFNEGTPMNHFNPNSFNVCIDNVNSQQSFYRGPESQMPPKMMMNAGMNTAHQPSIVNQQEEKATRDAKKFNNKQISPDELFCWTEREFRMRKKIASKKFEVLEVGDLVFAKIRGFSFWPARIESVSSNKYFVKFFASSNTGYPKHKDTLPIENVTEKCFLTKPGRDLLAAYKEILDDQRRIDKGFSYPKCIMDLLERNEHHLVYDEEPNSDEIEDEEEEIKEPIVSKRGRKPKTENKVAALAMTKEKVPVKKRLKRLIRSKLIVRKTKKLENMDNVRRSARRQKVNDDSQETSEVNEEGSDEEMADVTSTEDEKVGESEEMMNEETSTPNIDDIDVVPDNKLNGNKDPSKDEEVTEDKISTDVDLKSNDDKEDDNDNKTNKKVEITKETTIEMKEIHETNNENLIDYVHNNKEEGVAVVESVVAINQPHTIQREPTAVIEQEKRIFDKSPAKITPENLAEIKERNDGKELAKKSSKASANKFRFDLCVHVRDDQENEGYKMSKRSTSNQFRKNEIANNVKLIEVSRNRLEKLCKEEGFHNLDAVDMSLLGFLIRQLVNKNYSKSLKLLKKFDSFGGFEKKNLLRTPSFFLTIKVLWENKIDKDIQLIVEGIFKKIGKCFQCEELMDLNNIYQTERRKFISENESSVN
ncbi:hypothetical protein SNEBB_006395 [Seison nebaliae]|nr:hypothetical protein SNEBB_006395 [Seison nebaliae]